MTVELSFKIDLINYSACKRCVNCPIILGMTHKAFNINPQMWPAGIQSDSKSFVIDYCKNCKICLWSFRCMVKVTGDITVSFPASVLPLIYDTENAPMLSFLIRGTSCLEQILPNKALISRFVCFASIAVKFWKSLP